MISSQNRGLSLRIFMAELMKSGTRPVCTETFGQMLFSFCRKERKGISMPL